MNIWPFSRRSAPVSGEVLPAVTGMTSRPSFGRRLAQRMFAAARQDRLNATWEASPTPVDHVISRNWLPLVARSREQSINNDYAKAYLRMVAQNVVGPKGVQLQAQTRDDKGKLDQAANKAIEAAFEKWGNKRNAHVAGKHSWRQIQRAVVRATARDGECFVREIYGKDGGPWGFALQVIDAVNCPINYNVPATSATGNFIRQGIEFNQYGRPVAYYFSVPNETDDAISYQTSGTPPTRVPADEIHHVFLEDLTNQKRGLPWMATGLFRMRHLNGLEEAAVINARIGASKMGFIQYADGKGPEYDDDEGPDEIEATPGVFEHLPEGATIKEWSPQYPTGEFGPFYKTMLRGIASGFGVAYNNLSSDLEGVNFSSIRQGTLDEREHWKDLQEWLIEVLIQPVFESWLRRALLADRIKPAGGKRLRPDQLDRYLEVTWQGRRWAWIDPAADVKAAVDSKNNLLTSPGAIIREQGRDPSAVWADVAADIQAMKDAGIPENFIQMAMGQTMQGVAGKPGAEAKPEAKEKSAE